LIFVPNLFFGRIDFRSKFILRFDFLNITVRHEIGKRYKSCLASAQGKVIKVIAQLLPALDKDYHYRIIFMLREINEVLQSQQTMLNKAESDKDKLAQTFQQQLHRIQVWLRKQNNIDVIYVKYQDVIQQPLQAIEKLNDFLDEGLEVEKCLEF